MTAEGSADRGELWMERGRPEKAEGELRQALALDPDNVEVKARLAHCLMQLDRDEEGLVLAREAVGADPEWAYPRLVMAIGLMATQRVKDAEQVAREAIELDPELPVLHAVLATTLGLQKRWKEALAAAEMGLELDPENEMCLNERSSALTNLGQREQASEGLMAALQRNPENPQTHYHLGLNALHAGRSEESIRHFREALRLDPEMAGAREGLVEAMKSRTSLYRPFLAFFLLLGRLPQRQVYMILFGSVIARGFLASAARDNPSLGIVLWPIYYGIIAFILMSWIASPLFDLVLRLSKDGRYALSEAELFNSTCLGLVLLLAVIFLIAGFAGVPAMFLAAGFMGAWSIPLTRALHAPKGKRKNLHSLAAVALLVIGLVATVQRYSFESWWNEFGVGVQIVALPEELREQKLAELTPAQLERMGSEVEAFKAGAAEYSAKKRRSDSLVSAYMWGFVLLTWVP